MQPVASRPILTSDYGAPSDTDDLLPWSYVTDRMTRAMHFWISTVASDGAPHTRPIAGMWLDDQLYFGGSPESRWYRNLVDNPRACIHLSEEGDQAVILHGKAHLIRPDQALATRLAEASNVKYRYGQTPEDYQGEDIFVFHPRIVFAWKDFTRDRTRWHFRAPE